MEKVEDQQEEEEKDILLFVPLFSRLNGATKQGADKGLV